MSWPIGLVALELNLFRVGEGDALLTTGFEPRMRRSATGG